MSTIENELNQAIENASRNFLDDPMLRAFEKSNKQFSELVDKGVAKRRGNNQLPVDELHLHGYSFNTSV
mgnify:CR=1 FL=1|jgi:hypothetical protein